jgi:hypothetical protein
VWSQACKEVILQIFSIFQIFLFLYFYVFSFNDLKNFHIYTFNHKLKFIFKLLAKNGKLLQRSRYHVIKKIKNFEYFELKFSFISPHGDAILKKLKIRLNACIILLLLLYLIGVIFSVNFNF